MSMTIAFFVGGAYTLVVFLAGSAYRGVAQKGIEKMIARKTDGNPET